MMRVSWRDRLKLLLCVYTFGLVLYLLFRFLIAPKRIVICGTKVNEIDTAGPLIIVANHPSLLEPFLIPLLFGWSFLRRPSLIPWSTPDIKNFTRWYWRWWHVRAIMVPRGQPGGESGALKRMCRVLQAKGRLILFPEGGRTSSANPSYWLESRTGHRLRPLQGGLAWLVKKTGARVLPVWVENTDKVLPNKNDRLFHVLPRFSRQCPVILRLGRVLQFAGTETREAITDRVASTLLKLADQT